jgi:hypothetical protein
MDRARNRLESHRDRALVSGLVVFSSGERVSHSLENAAAASLIL